MRVQCPQCGESQLFDEGDRNCLKCGNPLSEKDTLILKNPRKGRGLIATAILSFLSCVVIFKFFNHFFAVAGMLISILLYVWGVYKVRLNRKMGAINNVDQK